MLSGQRPLIDKQEVSSNNLSNTNSLTLQFCSGLHLTPFSAALIQLWIDAEQDS
jgi:hypothetical protein